MSDRDAVLEVLGRYARAVDRRDAEGVATLFTPEGREVIRHDAVGETAFVAELVGRDQIAAAVRDLVGPLAPRQATHHTTHDHLVVIDGDEATIDAQFMVHDVRGAVRPDTGWPDGASGGQGTITLAEMGHYHVALTRTDAGWQMVVNEVTLDLPLALPDASAGDAEGPG